MKKRPLIGISGGILRHGDGPFAGYRRSYVNHDYIRSVTRAGGVPIILPCQGDDEAAREALSYCDGLILSGGVDIYSPNYDQDALPEIGEMSPERDHFDFLLLEEAESREIPILAICRGHQVVNVFHGGSLFQDLKYDKNSSLSHAAKQRPDLGVHTITIDEDSLLAHIIGGTEFLTNSFHHQTVDRVGDGLQVIATAKDGTVEAMEGTDYPWLLTTQFHPEMMSIRSPEARLIFDALVAQAGSQPRK